MIPAHVFEELFHARCVEDENASKTIGQFMPQHGTIRTPHVSPRAPLGMSIGSGITVCG